MTDQKKKDDQRGVSNTKFLFPVVMAIATGMFGAAGKTIYNHELMILKNARIIERLQVKDYRQHRDLLRKDVVFLADAADTLEAILDIEPSAFGANSGLVLKKRRSQMATAKEQLENYIEENKHGGRAD
jgi:hypothetical protein